MKNNKTNEFNLSLFAEFYEPISDTFIDIKQVSDSLKRQIPKGAEIFEIGLGTGYFASMFTDDGYKVKGIQPQDEMLIKLKQRNADIEILAECKLEEYEFTKQYDIIISHSSVFLFTQIDHSGGKNGEIITWYILQSFIPNKAEVIANIKKTLNALTSDGRLFINIQTNPLTYASIGNGEEQLTFEMTRCNYFLELGLVEKTFRLTYKGHFDLINDTRFCQTFTEFVNQITKFGFKVSISEDRYWIIVEHTD
jgi:SAM-dependent methyltransferase